MARTGSNSPVYLCVSVLVMQVLYCFGATVGAEVALVGRKGFNKMVVQNGLKWKINTLSPLNGVGKA